MKQRIRLGAIAAAVLLAAGAAAWSLRASGAIDTSADKTARKPSVLTVEVVAPLQQSWPQTVQASGPVSPWQEIIVSPETGGLRIAELLVDVGSVVKRGQLLARLADDSLQAELRKQQAAVAQAQANLDQAASNLQRARMVEGSGALSAQKMEEYRIAEATSRASLDSAKAELDSIKLKLSQTRIVAVDDGVVSSRTGVLGNVVSAGTELYRLVRQGKLEWRPELDARQVSTVRAGQPAQLTLPGGEQVQGQLRLVAPTLSTTTGRTTAYVSLPQGPARAGMFANGTLELGTQPALTLPQSAIVMRDGRAYVYLLGSNEQVVSRAVTVGRRQADRVEVLSGIDGRARVVAGGGAFLSDGAQVTVARAGSTK